MLCSFFCIPGLLAGIYAVLFLRVPVAQACQWCSYIACVPFPPGLPASQQWWTCAGPCEAGGLSGVVYVSNNTLQLTCPSDAGLPPITVYQQYPENVTIASAQEIETCEEQCPGGTSGLTVSPAAPLARSSLLAVAAAVAAAGLARG